MIILTENPRDYNLPYDSWYPNQRSLAEQCVNLNTGKVLLAESPTGTGKSLLVMAVSHFRKGTTALMSTRDLQKQYEDSFSSAAVVWGQSNYPCIDPKNVAHCKLLYSETPSRADCAYPSAKVARQECRYFSRCPYELAKYHAKSAQARILNYAYAYNAEWWKEGKDWDLFCDEAHRVTDVLSGLISIEVPESTASRFNLPDFPLINGGLRRDMDAACLWLATARQAVNTALDDPDIRHRYRANNLYNKLLELESDIASSDRETWYIKSGKQRFTARPVLPGNYAGKIIPDTARSIVLMSATIGNPKVMLADLGLEDREYEFISMPHAFPVENRPVFWVTNAPKIRYRTTHEECVYQSRIISKIVSMHNGEKGLIHTASWKHTNDLASMLGANGVGDRIMIADGARLETVEAFKRSGGGTVAISPSWQEGLNFPDDELRFAIVAKLPFLSQADPVVRMRMHKKGGNDWYKSNAALRVVQAAGRGVRHAGDWCVTYIVDSCWGMVEEYVPKWFDVEKMEIGI